MGREERTKSKPTSLPSSHQPSAAELARLKIKVKDFAYYNTLPPVRTVYLQPKQIQPSIPRPPYRENTEPLDEFPQSRPLYGGQALVRTITEPVIENDYDPGA